MAMHIYSVANAILRMVFYNPAVQMYVCSSHIKWWQCMKFQPDLLFALWLLYVWGQTFLITTNICK